MYVLPELHSVPLYFFIGLLEIDMAITQLKGNPDAGKSSFSI